MKIIRLKKKKKKKFKKKKREEEERNRMTASVLKQDPNAKRFKRTLVYFNTDTQYANSRGNPLYQATKRHLNNRQTEKNDEKKKKKTYLVLFLVVVCVKGDFPKMCVLCVRVKRNKCSFEPFCVWI